ncbi:UPF0171-domain-containing protein [Xylona heveae TC161]|uniref:Nitrogen permease regulator 3 n=1 Tax=Xylona heveae (strain CBS 132557 / TC161) TaxID=1328760 RepID=A0A164Z8W9_XYLHT|nr:UPF0171-domain-containing protein [Xylona heveae TC161]KZF18826.1 UPF0171-domain-containing protein [Xylona heveae TC161]
MYMSSLPPNPCLVAILLIVKSRAGPRFVFHYPPQIRQSGSSSQTAWHGAYGTSSSMTDDSSNSSEEDEWSSDEDYVSHHRTRRGEVSEADRSLRASRANKRSRNPEEDEDDSSSSESEKRRDSISWERVLGFSTDGLEKILSPDRIYHKKKYELNLDPWVFVGCPMFVKDSGKWMKKKKEKRREAARSEAKDEPHSPKSSNAPHQETDGARPRAGRAHFDLEAQDDADEEDDAKSTSTNGGDSNMTMFHIVFVMNPPVLEYQLRVREMYDHIVKKLARVLKYEQARSNYVWRESQNILSMKEKAKEAGTPINTLWQNIIANSSLARAMGTVYDAISSSRIAHIVIDSSYDTSLQIPQQVATPYLPAATEPQMPGLWLTTANNLTSPVNPAAEDETSLGPHFALLFLKDVPTLLKEISSDSTKDVSGPLAHYIRCSKPTMSFLQVSNTHNIPLADIQILAQHLIYWRRARAIPPLHQRDTYILSPNADMSSLTSATASYAASFPTLPSLPKMLSMLSGPPKPYSALIPSKDHRPAYLEILAWLLRGGWVTQLRTFGWIRVPAYIKEIVAQEQHREQSMPVTPEATPPPPQAPGPLTTTTITDPTTSALASSPNSTFHAKWKERSASASSPRSTQTDHLAFRSSTPTAAAADTSTASIILDPHKANATESRWIDAIAKHALSAVSEEHPDLRTYWPIFVRYFNGQHALEKISAREGIKRREVWRLLAAVESVGVLSVVRHW